MQCSFIKFRLLLSVAWQQHWKTKVQSCGIVMHVSRQRPRQVLHLPVVEPTFSVSTTTVASPTDQSRKKTRNFQANYAYNRRANSSSKSVDTGPSVPSNGRQKLVNFLSRSGNQRLDEQPLKSVGRPPQRHKVIFRSSDQRCGFDTVHEKTTCNRHSGRYEPSAPQRTYMVLPNNSISDDVIHSVLLKLFPRKPEHPTSLSAPATARPPTARPAVSRPVIRQKSDVRPATVARCNVSPSRKSNEKLLCTMCPRRDHDGYRHCAHTKEHSLYSPSSFTETKHYVSPALSGVNGLAKSPRKKVKCRSPRRRPPPLRKQAAPPPRPSPLILPIVCPEFSTPRRTARPMPQQRYHPIDTLGFSRW